MQRLGYSRFKVDPATHSKDQIELSFEKRDNGIAQAMASADSVNESWSDHCYQHLVRYIGFNGSGFGFLIEDFRAHVQDQLPTPPSLRAFGGVVVRAFKKGLIIKGKIMQVNNPRAHRANAQQWLVV